MAHFEARACQDQFVVTGMKGGFKVKEGTILQTLESFMTPEMIGTTNGCIFFVMNNIRPLWWCTQDEYEAEERLSSVLEETTL